MPSSSHLETTSPFQPLKNRKTEAERDAWFTDRQSKIVADQQISFEALQITLQLRVRVKYPS